MKYLRLILSFLFLLSSIRSSACDCNGKLPIHDAFKNADVVIHGVVVSSSTIPIHENSYGRVELQKLVIRAIRVYKGDSKEQEFRITTSHSNADCGYEFEIGKAYIIYAYFIGKYMKWEIPPVLHVSSCSRTIEYNNKEARNLNRIINLR